MIRSGWLEVQDRQYVRVQAQIAQKSAGQVELQRSIRAVAHKWKLGGGSQEELLAQIRSIVGDVFESEGQLVFTECNAADLNFMGKQLEREMPNTPIARVLIQDLDPVRLREARAVVLAPYYHYVEVKDRVGKDVSIVPVHSSPTAETLDEILTIPEGAKVLVIGHNSRSLSRLSGMVRDYANAKITAVTESELAKIAKAAPAADVVVAVWSVVEALNAIAGIKRLIVVRFVLDTSVNARLDSWTRSRKPNGG